MFLKPRFQLGIFVKISETDFSSDELIRPEKFLSPIDVIEKFIKHSQIKK